MLRLFFLAVLLFAPTSQSFAQVDVPSSIVGKWQYIGHYYREQFQLPMNPNLILTFEFREDGTDILSWRRNNEDGFCERMGRYYFDGKRLYDEVVWVNPNNSFECGKDPDMKLGTRSDSPLKKENDRLLLELPLGDDKLIYVWQRISK